MSNFLSKFRLKTAQQANKNKFDLSCQHITTNDFFKLRPVYIREMIPNESIDIDMETFTRLQTLNVPTFGRVQLKNRAMFVPMRTIMKDWNNFINNLPCKSGTGVAYNPLVPQFSDAQIISLYRTENNQLAVPHYPGVDPNFDTLKGDFCDWSYEEGEYVCDCKYIFTTKGKHFFNILRSLGYNINWLISNTRVGSQDAVKYSALPLLAFAKIWNDWYRNTNYSTEDIEYLFNQNSTVGANLVSTTNLLKLIDSICSISYDKDYFTASWTNPTSPSAGQDANLITMQDTSLENLGDASKSSIQQLTTTNGTPVIRGASGSNNVLNFSQYLDEALHKVTDYVKRHQMVGTRALDRFAASFGVELKSEKLNRSVYVGDYNVPVQIGEVISNAATDDAVLGEYAGKGVGYNKGHFHFETDEFGYFIIVSEIIPHIGYVQGFNRHVMHKDIYDFFTPEFDALGVQGVYNGELFNDFGLGQIRNSTAERTNQYDAIFGYLPRYAEYCVGKDTLSGDFVIPSINTGEDAWHMNRMFTLEDNSMEGHIKVGLDFQTAEQDSRQYDRIFSLSQSRLNEEAQPENFRITYDFGVTSYMPKKTLFDDYDYEQSDDAKGKTMTMDINGTQLN